jgi:hypothetical protein
VWQLSAVDELLDGGRLGRVPADLNRACIFAAQAQDAITDLPHLTRPSNRYNLAYDACHDLGQALLAAYGYRTTNGPGQHETLGMFFRIVIDGPPGDRAAQRFDQLRRARNQQRYTGRAISDAEADLAAQTASTLLASVVDRGVSG